MRAWFYSLYRTRLSYKIDKETMIVYVDVNKPMKYLAGDDRTSLEDLCAHLNAGGYHVIVRD
jgi:hypothetical protein